MPGYRRGVLSNVRVLVVEDNADSREVMAVTLEHAGALVTAAATLDEALAVAASTNPHVLVTDIALIERDGFAVLRELRASSPERSTIPAIAVSAHGRLFTEAQILGAGFQAYLEKPLDLDVLVETIRRVARAEA